MGANCQVEQHEGGKMVIKAEANPMQSVGSACTNISVADKDSKGMTNQKLLAASRDNDLDGVKSAIGQGAYLETRRPFVMRPKPPAMASDSYHGKKRKTPKEGLTPLMYSAQNGSVEAATLLLEARAQVRARDEDGLEALHFAARAGALEVAKLLIAKGADRDAADDDGRRAVDHIVEEALEERGQRQAWQEILGPPTAVPAASAAEQLHAAASAESGTGAATGVSGVDAAADARAGGCAAAGAGDGVAAAAVEGEHAAAAAPVCMAPDLLSADPWPPEEWPAASVAPAGA
eukprot:TRINITY_DN10184_c0_g1_i1.p1 TRINITY_DN10184_c0_g1~~TRINITY_DN10184_c0_g1_i1.p1  ORF type:complete len:324 (+),score=66.24 TRINITY_DN10184_c0_g1_i1:101-973(+)